jgi:hypothetical protein
LEIETLLSGDTRGKRVAGVCMLVSAGLWTLAFLVAETLSTAFLSVLAGAPLGYFLLRGHRWAAKPSLVVLFVGLVLATLECPAGTRQWLLVPGLMVASLTLLLVGDGGRARIVAGTVLFAMYVLGMVWMIALSRAAWD